MGPIKVMLVDDSLLFMGAMKAAVEKDPRMTVVSTATNGEDALTKVAGASPDVIICDVQMPKMNGIEFLKALLPRHKIPVLVISGTPGMTLTALANGAVDFIPKPAPGEPSSLFFLRMLSAIRVAAQANVGAKSVLSKAPVQAASVGVLTRTHKDVVVAIGASTGGTDATLEVVRNLPQNFPGIVITQHMPAGFTAMYAERMNRECKMRVREAKNGDRVEQGLMLLAAGDNQMRLEKDASGYYVSQKPGEKVNGHRPSVEVLFNSVAEKAAKRSVGIILTGMGGDGAEGLLRMRKAGAYTIGQDKATCVVYGMPMVAYQKGAVVTQLPLNKIPGQLIAQMNKM